MDLGKPFCLFDISEVEELGEVFNLVNTQTLFEKDHQLKATKC